MTAKQKGEGDLSKADNPDAIQPQVAVAEVKDDLRKVKILTEDEQQAAEIQRYTSRRMFWEVSKINAPEWKFTALGFVGSLLSGSLQPVFAIIFGNVLQVFYEQD